MKNKPGKAEQRLRKLGAKIDELVEFAQKSKSSLKKVNVEDLLKRKKEAREKLQELKGTGGEALKELKSGLESAWGELGKAVDSALGKFNKKP